jgi:GTP-binding protein Era
MSGQPPEHKAGYVAILGRPNVGKSTLLNALMGQKIAAVSPRPQTTRRRQLGILTLEKAQVIFIDTPGMHKPVHKLGEFMNEEALAALEDADVLVFMVDASQSPGDEDRLLAGPVNRLQPPPPLLLALNKIDLVAPENLPGRQAAYQALVPTAFPKAFSALTGYQAGELLQEIIDRLPAGQPFFEEDQVTDFYEREIAGELVREAAMNFLHDEVPHCITVRVDEYTERGEGGAYIAATLFVERESQKGIVIGQAGTMLKKIGASARKEIESMSGRKVFLELRVKVQKNWRNSPDALRLLGFHHKEED